MTTIHHGTFTIERIYKAPQALVFRAFEDTDAKRRWFAQGDDENWQVESFETDFQVGGMERSRFRYAGGPLISNDTVYLDIARNERIIIAYTMADEGNIFSSSMSTIRIRAARLGHQVDLHRARRLFRRSQSDRGSRTWLQGPVRVARQGARQARRGGMTEERCHSRSITTHSRHSVRRR